MSILKAPIAGKEKDIEKAFASIIEAECKGAKVGITFDKKYDGYRLKIEKMGVKRDLFLPEIRLVSDHDEKGLTEAVKYEAQSIERDTIYPSVLELAREG
jgi:hypothetical protein